MLPLLTDFLSYRGRVALHLILHSLGIGSNDEVILQAFTCLAVPEAIMASGAQPVYVDICRNGVNMDPTELAQRISPKTRAVVVQHTFGVPADLGPILDITKGKGIAIIEDCAHTLFSCYRSQRVGSFGEAAFYSFEWGKPLIAGIGGSAVINSPKLQKEAKKSYSRLKKPTGSALKARLQYAAHSLLYRPYLYWPVRDLYHALSSLGLLTGNYNPVNKDVLSEDFSLTMSDFHKKRLLEKLKKVEEITEMQRRVANAYKAGISSNAVTPVAVPVEADTVYARYPLIASDKTELLRQARKARVELAQWYATPIHPLTKEQWSLVHYSAGSCPNAENMADALVSLPINAGVTPRYLDRTFDFLNKMK